MKKYLKIILLVFFTIGLSQCSETIGLKKLYGQNVLQLNSSQLKRFEDYLKGEYYSFELQRNVSHKPIMFAISSDGSTSLIFSCASNQADCNVGVHIYQLVKRYSKKSGKDLKIFALKNKIVWGANTVFINTKNVDIANLSLTGVIFVNSKETNDLQNTFYDISILPLDSKDDDFSKKLLNI